MIRQREFVGLLVLAAGALALTRQAGGVLITISAAPAPNVAGYTVYSFTIDPTMGGPTGFTGTVTSFDAKFTLSSGLMNQINPSSAETVFEDFNSFFAMPFTGDDDSQFEFTTSEWTSTPSMESNESSTLLEGVASGKIGAPLSSSFVLAHVVIQNSAIGSWMIETIVNNMDMDVQSGAIAVPEASQVVVGGIAATALLAAFLRRYVFSKAPPMTRG